VKVSCTTCRLKHDEAERVDRPSRDFGSSAMDSCCPRCGGRVWVGILAKPIGRRIYARGLQEWRDSYNAQEHRQSEERAESGGSDGCNGGKFGGGE
jgi:hypothetical protein